jgi:hypothetical protein
MFVIIYRWLIKTELEQQFVENWSEITKYYISSPGSLGSRLHRGSDGLYYAYAQWEAAEDREYAFQNIPAMAARDKLKETIDESFPEVLLEIKADFLISAEN